MLPAAPNLAIKETFTGCAPGATCMYEASELHLTFQHREKAKWTVNYVITTPEQGVPRLRRKKKRRFAIGDQSRGPLPLRAVLGKCSGFLDY